MWKRMTGLPQPRTGHTVHAVEEGFLQLSASHGETIYRFTHDRVQEAIDATLTETQRQQLHLHIARRLLAEYVDISEVLYELVGHLQKGFAQIEEAQA